MDSHTDPNLRVAFACTRVDHRISGLLCTPCGTRLPAGWVIAKFNPKVTNRLTGRQNRPDHQSIPVARRKRLEDMHPVLGRAVSSVSGKQKALASARAFRNAISNPS